MRQPGDDAICHVSACGQPAEHVCDGCGKPCCAEHCRTVMVERRDNPAATRNREPLARIASHMETDLLCRRCSTKPITAVAGRQRTASS